MHPNTLPPDRKGDNGSPPERLIIVVGDNRLTLRFIDNLIKRYGYRVMVIIGPGPGGQREEIRRWASRSPSLEVFERARITAETIRDAGLIEAYAVALMDQNDVGNLHLALKIREMSYDLADETLPKLVIRMYNRQLRDRIKLLLDEGVYVESDADMVARTYGAAALGQIPPGEMDIWDRRLYLEREPDPRAGAQWVVASGNGGGVEMISENPEESVRVLCLVPERKRRRFRSKPGTVLRFLRRTENGLRRAVDTKLRIAALALIAIMSAGIWSLAHFSSRVNPVENGWDALYIITLIAGGGIDPDLESAAAVKITHGVVVMSGSLIIPIVTGAIVQAMVARRYALSEGRIVESVRDHVIVVGLGNIGTRVVEHLREERIPVVAIEKDRRAVGIQAARAVGAQVLLGDASRPETLREADIDHCLSLVAMANEDSANLEAALSGLECNRGLRTVMRIYSDDFARLVRRRLNKRRSPRDPLQHRSYSAPEVAAASFAAALTDDEIHEVIPVRGHLVYIGEVTVAPGAPLGDAEAREATVQGSHRLLAVRRDPEGVRWDPDAAFRIRAGDKLLVMATRDGYKDVQNRSLYGQAPPP
ncbi:potassium channel family protein [Glycomyces xiaoerkulensis]|uniref:potassium channel family protein n=1 Tax=Glycomyces xiaoerkulensis TaxID=2038139 RepID=UPI0012FFF20D|nr:potassium channel protein [Glycomyces xiaoerkulensis]